MVPGLRRIAAGQAALPGRGVAVSSQPSPGVPDFETWLRQEGGARILRKAYYLTRDPKLAEDIGQAAAAKISKAWADEDKRGKILASRAYTATIVVNCYRDYLRARSRTGRENETEYHDDVMYGRPGTGVDHDLQLAIASLDSDERAMIIACYYDRSTIEEAGSQLCLPPSRAYRLHTKALASLKRALTEGEA